MKTKNYKFIISTTSILINNKINRIFVRLIVNFHEALNESSINIQRTMEKTIPFIREFLSPSTKISKNYLTVASQ